MRTNIDKSLYLTSSDGEDVTLQEHTGDAIEGRSLPDHALLIAQHALRLEAVLRLAGELERLKTGEAYDSETPDVFIIRSSAGYFGTIDDERIDGDITTAADAARVAYGLPGSMAGRVAETLEVT